MTSWFLKSSGIADAQGRVGEYPGRTEAEAMTLEGYAVTQVTPWEVASGGKAVECKSGPCTAGFEYGGAAGWHTLRVQYFDQNNGVSHFRLWIADQLIDEWTATNQPPSRRIDGSSSTRRTIPRILLRPGDRIRIEGMPDGGDLRPSIMWKSWPMKS